MGGWVSKPWVQLPPSLKISWTRTTVKERKMEQSKCLSKKPKLKPGCCFFSYFPKIIVGGDIAGELLLAGLLPHSPILGLKGPPIRIA